MFGWINDCTECLVISKFGEETWHKIKQQANCDVADGGFLRYKYYPDGDTVQLVVAASQVLGISVDDVLYAFGDYFIEYVQDNGYSNVLECLGSNMRDWLANLNSLHDHLQASYPKGFVAPVFWSEDDDEHAKKHRTVLTKDGVDTIDAGSIDENSEAKMSASNGSEDGQPKEPVTAILVHYYSQRGSLLVPLVVGLIHKLAKEYFDIDIKMDQLQLQDEDNNIPHTTWRVTTVDPEESWKLRGKKKKKKKKKGGQIVLNDNGSVVDSGSIAGDTVTTSATSITNASKYPRAFREGGTQARNLRVEELIKRSFYNETCELYHALTLEHYTWLMQHWKTNKIVTTDPETNVEVHFWCYEVWNMIDNEPSSWPSIKDLPPALHPDTQHPDEFGRARVGTGKYPPVQSPYDSLAGANKMTPQSIPPILRIYLHNVDGSGDSNGENNKEHVDLEVKKDPNYFLDDVMYKDEKVQVLLSRDDVLSSATVNNMDIQCIIWNNETNENYHTFALSDLSGTSTKQLYELVPKQFDPIYVVIQCTEGVTVDDDEEDI